MNDKVLSQNEVDVLLKGVDEGDIETESKPVDEVKGVRKYDFLAHDRIIRGRMPGLEIANDRFCRLLRVSLASVIMKFVDVNIHNMEMMIFSDFMKTLPLPSSINIFRMEPLKGYALFVMEAPLVFALIEYFFGSDKARFVKSEGRFFTPIEQRVIKRIAGLVLSDLKEAWEEVAPIKPEHMSLEMNPQFVSIVTPTEGVIKIDIEIEVEDFEGKAYFCIPYSMVEPVREKLYAGIQGDKMETDHRWVEMLTGVLKDSNVEVVVEIDRAKLTVSELMKLQKGDVVTLGKFVTDELEIKVQDMPKFKGLPGISRANQAIKITKFL